MPTLITPTVFPARFCRDEEIFDHTAVVQHADLKSTGIGDDVFIHLIAVFGHTKGLGAELCHKARLLLHYFRSSVNAEAFNSSAAIGSDKSSATVNIEDHADVTAVGYGVAIGTGYGHEYNGGTSTVINITGGTVNAVTRDDSGPAIGTVNGNLDLTIDSSTGKTTVRLLHCICQ